MTLESLNRHVEKQRGKSGGWPSDLIYRATDDGEVIVSVAASNQDGALKKIDPWGFAFLDEVRHILTDKTPRLTIEVGSPNTKTAGYQYEALKRRVSYLGASNGLQITMLKGGSLDRLYTLEELTGRPDNEVVHQDFKKRGDDDTAGRLEKDFQAYLFGKGLHDDADPDIRRTNERLALFGKDFVRIGKIKYGTTRDRYRVEREFPTGVFDTKVKESERILSTEYVDLVTVNRRGDLAVIELKFDDPKLEVIPQVLNYALFFHSYRTKLSPVLDRKLECATEGAKLVTYLVSNTFHGKFDSVWGYYSRGPLTIKRVIMGCMCDHPTSSLA
jgi:hypothetical protein